MTRWGAGPVLRDRRRNHGSRDPIRVYLEERRRDQRRRQALWVLGSILFAIVLWAMVVTVLVTLG